jgi:hypothetical protein
MVQRPFTMQFAKNTAKQLHWAARMRVINESGRLTERAFSWPEKLKPFHRLSGSPRPPWWIAVTSARADSIDVVRSSDHTLWEKWLTARDSITSSNRSG